MDFLLLQQFGAACTGGNFLFFPPWYKYLGSSGAGANCSPVIGNINDVWLIVAAIVEILLRVAALAAVVFIIWAGVEYLTSQAEPAKVAKARQMLIDALVGLVIALLATAIINFIAGSLK